MNHRLLLAIFSLAHIAISFGQDNEQYTNCRNLVQCGNFPGLGYPFWGGNRPDYCGHASFQTNCRGNSPFINIKATSYRVLAVDDRSRTMTVVGEDFEKSRFCPSTPKNTTLDQDHFEYAPGFQDLTLYYGCQAPSNLPILNRFPCTSLGDNSFAVYTSDSVGSPFEGSNNIPLTCGPSINVRVNGTIAQGLQRGARNPVNITQVLDSGFGLVWKANDKDCDVCEQSGGRCGSSSGSFTCYCKDQPYPATCNSSQNSSGASKNSNTGIKVALPITGALLAGVGLGWLIFSLKQRRKRAATKATQIAQAESKNLSSPSLSRGLTTNPLSHFSRSNPSLLSSTSLFGKSSTYFGTQIFSYSELEAATDNFNPDRELGDGGFGTVYYGTLQDGRVVAVKRLYENNFKRVEQFMNEVEILTRLNHIHLVNLYGCTSKRSRELLLVYEYIPNGTVADHLHGRQSSSALLSWPIRFKIAVETADALAYLHASDIIHRDVKTNNILLEKDFRVKVADFGLSRLFPTDVTHVSTAPQGTPGYVDPEYYQCYQLTEKSDVYSFGVVLVELISSKQAVDTNRDRQDINLANMAISRIQNHALRELVDPSLGFETNSSVTKMITKVAELAFRCLQNESALRPSMNEILTALRGLESQISNVQEAEVVDIVIDDDGVLLKGNYSPKSSDSTVNEKWATNSA